MSRRTSNNVSLFPFLAVLVCAMGALILLLLVTTRRIRSDQLQELQAAEVETKDAGQAAVEPPPVAPTLTEIKVPTREPSVFPSHPALVVSDVPASVSDPSRDTHYQQRDQVALRGYGAMLKDQIAKSNESNQQLQARFASLRNEKRQLTEAADKLDKQAGNTAAAKDNVEETKRRLDAQLAALRRAIDKQESEPVNAVSKYRIVPFDGLSGTIRRPIMIECDGNRFRFIPEDVQLSQAEVESFVGGFNPLLSGAAALTAYWAKKDSESGEAVGDPYVLLVVRPGGSMGFYTAKRMLRSLKLPIGYELVPKGRELELPAADPVAVRLCRQAIASTLERKDQIRSLQPLTKSLLAQVERDRARGFGAPPGMAGDQNSPPPGDARTRRFNKSVASRFDPYSNGLSPESSSPRAADRSLIPPSRRRLGQFPPGQAPVAQVPPDPSQFEPGQPRTLPFLEGGTNPSQPAPGVVAMPGPVTPERVGEKPTGQGLAELPEYTSKAGRQGSSKTRVGRDETNRGTPPLVPPADPPQSNAANAFGQWEPPTEDRQGGTPRLPPGVRSNQAGQPGQGNPPVVTDSSTKPGEAGQSKEPAKVRGSNSDNQPKVQYRRAVPLYVGKSAVVVGSNKQVAVSGEQVSGPWLGTVLTQIEAEVRAWGPAPTGMQWAPEVRFRIKNGGETTHQRVRDALRRLGIRTTEETAGPTTATPVIQQQSGTRWRSSRTAIRRAGGSR